MKHIVIGGLSALSFLVVITVGFLYVSLWIELPIAAGVLTAMVVFGSLVAFIDWYTEKQRGE